MTNPNGESALSSYPFVTVLERQVFITSTEYRGDLGGIAGADAECAARAAAGGHPGTFLAWIADGVTDPARRFPQNVGPYLLLGDSIVAVDFADLTDGTLAAPIDVAEDGVALPVGENKQVWTGTATDGTSTGDDCSGWTSSDLSATGTRGFGDATGATWTEGAGAFCLGLRRLYCFEQ